MSIKPIRKIENLKFQLVRYVGRGSDGTTRKERQNIRHFPFPMTAQKVAAKLN